MDTLGPGLGQEGFLSLSNFPGQTLPGGAVAGRGTDNLLPEVQRTETGTVVTFI